MSFFLQNILCNPEHHCEMDVDSSHLLQRGLHQRKCCSVLSLPSTHMLLSPLAQHTQTLWFSFPFPFLFCVCKHRQGAQLLDGNELRSSNTHSLYRGLGDSDWVLFLRVRKKLKGETICLRKSEGTDGEAWKHPCPDWGWTFAAKELTLHKRQI